MRASVGSTQTKNPPDVNNSRIPIQKDLSGAVLKFCQSRMRIKSYVSAPQRPITLFFVLNIGIGHYWQHKKALFCRGKLMLRMPTEMTDKL
jgi:hypothetical protein